VGDAAKPELAFRLESVPGIRMWQMRPPRSILDPILSLTDGSGILTLSLDAEHDDVTDHLRSRQQWNDQISDSQATATKTIIYPHHRQSP